MRSMWITLAICLVSWSSFGQSDRGTITGTVSDPAGAVVASVPVEAKNTSTGAVYPTVTSGTGNYTISEMPVGTYEISVTAPGFKKTVRTGVEVATSTTFRVD